MKLLQKWVEDQCHNHRLSWREASIKAGLNPGAVSAIINGKQPGLRTCKALAKLFGVSVVSVLQWAGHIEDTNYNTLSTVERAAADPRFAAFAALWPQLKPSEQEAFHGFFTAFAKRVAERNK